MATADSMVMMALGDYRFSLNAAAYQELTRTNSWRWPTVDRIGARPASQFVGPGEDSIQMTGCIYPHFKGGLGQLDAMRAEADKGEPLILVDGTGKNWGKYVITDIREGQTTFFSNGAPRRQDFDITLQAYGDDAVTPAVAAAAPVAAAAKVAAPVTGAAKVLSKVDKAMADVRAAMAKVNAEIAAVRAAVAPIASAALLAVSEVRALTGLSLDGLNSFTDAIVTGMNVLGGVDRLADATMALVDSSGAIMAPSSLAQFAAIGVDIQNVVNAATAAGVPPINAIAATLSTVDKAVATATLVATVGQDAAKIYGALAEGSANG